LNRQRVSISSIGKSCESCVKKYWSWLSDSDCQSLGKDKLKNASILRKYGSICMGEKTKIVFQIFEVLLNSESSNFHAVFCVFVIRVANNNAIFTWGKIFQYNVI